MEAAKPHLTSCMRRARKSPWLKCSSQDVRSGAWHPDVRMIGARESPWRKCSSGDLTELVASSDPMVAMMVVSLVVMMVKVMVRQWGRKKKWR